jgi:succinylornithine aminotransferase
MNPPTAPSLEHNHPLGRADFDRLMVQTYAPSSMVPVKANGVWVFDDQNKAHLDFTSGIAVTSLGHTHPQLLQALWQQANAIWHTSNGFTNQPALALAEKLIELTFADRVFFANSGAEANEAALKLARKYGNAHAHKNKTRILSCLQSFHGRTLFTVSVGGQPKYSQDFAPLPPNLSHLPFNDIAAAKAAMADDVCAIIVEPVQGEGGVVPAHANYLQTLRDLCDQHSALLIFDEVQCGVGRTGSFFAYQHYGIIPDVLTSAKALGNGFPVAAMLTTDKFAQVLALGSHGTTYGGNPLACAVAKAVVDIIGTPAFLTRVQTAAERLKNGLVKLQAQYPQVFASHRGLGLMQGLVLAQKFCGKAKEFTRITEKNGLLTLMAGPDVVRLLPPLVINDDEIDEGLHRLQISAQEFSLI